MKKVYTKYILLFCLLLIISIVSVKAQFIYPNDICSGAKPLPIGNTGQLNDSAFQGNSYANPAASTIPTCEGDFFSTSYDLWYSFIAPDTSIAVVPEQLENGGRYQLFSGGCAALSSMQCNPATGIGSPNLSGLVPGQQYYMRTLGMPFAHKISLVSKPVNDDCTGAALLPVNAVNAPAYTANRFSNALATVPVNNVCDNNQIWNNYKDVWYKWVATSTAHTVYMMMPTSLTRASVYRSASGMLTGIASFQSSSFSVTTHMQLSNLSIGETYYIRVGATATVNFHIGIFQGTPANDECAGADTVVMSSSFKCENNFAVNRLGATNSISPCSNSAQKNGWYIFKATAPDVTVTSSGDGAFALRLGLLEGNCGALTCLVNSSSSSLTYSGLTIGNYYYLTAGSISGEEQTAYICIAPKITNDDCSSASMLVVKPYNQLRTNIGYNKGANVSMPACQNSNVMADVWYRFTATDTACLISIDAAGTQQCYFQVLAGNCGSLNSIHCSSTGAQPASVTERTERIGGLVVGSSYYVRYYTPEVFAGTFTIDINSLPANDTCTGAVLLTPQQGLAYEPLLNNGILHASTSLPACVSPAVTKDIWYKFIATQPTMAIISNRENGNQSDGTTLGFQVYSGSCGNLISVACIQQGSPFALHKARTFTDLVPGETYYIRQYGNVDYNSFTIIEKPVNDDMAGAVKVPLSAINIQPMPSYYLHGASKQFGKIYSNANYTIHHDVWFYFIAAAASHTVSTNAFNSYWSEQLSGYSHRIETFRGYAADSTSLAAKAINCGLGSLTVNGLTAGDTVYVRIANTSAAGNTSIFSIKVATTQNIDEPTGALVLNELNDYQYFVNTTGATQSIPASGCLIPDFPDDDIWFQFTASPTIKRIVAGFENRDITLQLFSGTAGSLTALQCSNNIMVLPPGLINQTVYFVRAYSKANTLSASFRIGLFAEADMMANSCVSIDNVGPNLVLNPRCESEYRYLLPKNEVMGPALVMGRKLAEGWSAASFSTPDIWNADYPYGEWGNLPGDAGSSRDKIPRSGKGALGMLATYNWSEYVSGKLVQSLVKGKYYLVSFYVSMNKAASKDCYNIGALLSNDSIISGSIDGLSIVPHIANAPDQPVTEENSWRNICGIVYADKSYSFINIGNFGNPILYGGPGTYFFIDDVVVAEVTNPVVLPVNLLSFRGRTNTLKQTGLSWETADEINTKNFEVEWRTDGTGFSVIGTIVAKGNQYNAYNFLHKTPADGYNYYRLKMNDNDGRFTYSSIVKTGNNFGSSKLTINPNPASSTLNITSQVDKDELVFFRMLNSEGKVVATKWILLRKGSNLFTWNITQLAAGNYFISSTNKNFNTLQIIKQ